MRFTKIISGDLHNGWHMDRLLGKVYTSKHICIYLNPFSILRDLELGAKELFLYSKSDFYTPYRCPVEACLVEYRFLPIKINFSSTSIVVLAPSGALFAFFRLHRNHK